MEPTQFYKKRKVMEDAVAVAAPDDGGAAVALEQQVGAEAEAVVEAKPGVIVPGKSITLNQIQRDRITKIATANRSVEERRADLQQAPARSRVHRSVGGSPGIRLRLGKWIVECRLRASNSREWIGTFDTEEEAKFAYDAAQHFMGNPTYYFDYPEGYFELCPPRFKNTPLTKDFRAFVKEKANKYAKHDQKLQLKVLTSEAPTLTDSPFEKHDQKLFEFAFDGAAVALEQQVGAESEAAVALEQQVGAEAEAAVALEQQVGAEAEAAVALEQQVGAEAEAVVEAKLGVIVPGKSITLNQIQRDRITKIATANWSVTRNGNASVAFNAQLVVDIYRTELTVSAPLQRVMVLEISQYLENYLWPHFDPLTATFEHVMSIILMVNEKVTHLNHMIFYHCYQRNL
jgi:hypothetical protein